ncbi:MAG: AAA family ATPase [Eubacterium sp.]|jgi:predicted ATPase|nr:AAA family ATPase [Eubacterium sp.]
MILHFIIRNFGRIESADISLNNFVVFVGNNNSGKTMVMQLIYGIRKQLENMPVPLSGAKQSEMDGQYLIRCDQEWFWELEQRMNEYLAENRLRMMKDIFGAAVSAEEIKIILESAESEYFVSSITECQNGSMEEETAEASIDIRQYENGENKNSFEHRISGCSCRDNAVEETLKAVWRIILSGKTAAGLGQLFLPASRSGLQLLYKHYFAVEAAGNLVMPVKDFLRFLQLYAGTEQLLDSRRSLLEFGEEHLLQGKVVQEGDETFYADRQGDRMIPLYLASSMIHELAPFIKALSAVQKIDWLYCDEAENSLHPLLQGEMARWLIRMVNAGMHIIISSHSDTMASRLNNLFMLSRLNWGRADYKMLSELELMKADLLRPDMKASVYEFQNGKQGNTAVEELEFMSHPLMGYDFQLFGQNLNKLYDEADRITR